MATSTLLVDFGSSRIKCALWSHAEQAVIAQAECAGPPTIPVGHDDKVEVVAELYWQALEATAGRILQEQGDKIEIDGLWLCCEMHGILVLPDSECVSDTNNPVPTYISWRDGRAMQRVADGCSTYETLVASASTADEFFASSGMKLKAGLPFLTLAHLQRTHAPSLPKAIRLFTLADWLLWRGGERDPGIHASLAAGTGFYDLAQQAWSPRLLQLAGLGELSGHSVRLPRVLPTGQPLGNLVLCGRKISMFGAIGDMQAASFGAGFPLQGKMMVNLGTGSQVLCQLPGNATIPPGIESRPGVLGGQFTTITHIPCGRALNVFAAFFDDCALAAGGQAFFWPRFTSLSVAQVLAADNDIDIEMGVFAAAWRYRDGDRDGSRDGGAIRHIHEGRFSLDTMLAALAKSWLMQYANAIKLLDPARQQSTFLLGGGLSRRAAFILPVLEVLTERTGQIGEIRTGEETLDGLLRLAQGNSNVS